MIVKVDYKKFQETLKKHYPDCNYAEAEAAEAFHNLADFIKLLMEISERQAKEREKQTEAK